MPLIPYLIAGAVGAWAGIKVTGGFDRIGLVLGLLLVCYILYKKGFKL
ncbi:hypothetical protein ACGRSR_06630 [Vibrio owensii]|uniref:Uncharacterized protein n=1 Tax=Vibrio campbellii TaxID=680 RepID=A0AAQ2XUI7_9VIBR|nr:MULTISPECIES: hypothetical protein [Vibrio]AXB31444.1 hypothetical protein DSB67_07580 [Vibrio campbellii]WDG06858.1 hypothetical protein PUN50_08845 [Vibrio campbellii]CAD7825483.1 hypothetical protein ACOMICROBIO_NCLOACGD_04756 [Vibrio sp. B1ASS3]CAE6957098.1 hypothetical protein ACOMICROBIO_NCLOACGD_04756 [Vibrio sp. B1ASS3]